MRRSFSQSGFTLIELLITVLIIGLLAAVSLGAYNGQRDRAHEAQAKTMLRNAFTAIESHYTEGETYRGVNCWQPADSECGQLKQYESSLSAEPPDPDPAAAQNSDNSYSATPGEHADPSKILVFVDSLPPPWAGQYMEICNASKGRYAYCITRWRDPDNVTWSYTYYAKSTADINTASYNLTQASLRSTTGLP